MSKRSDGKIITSSRPQPSTLVSCPSCEDPFLLTNSKPESTIEIEPPKTKSSVMEFLNSLDLQADDSEKNVQLSWDRLPEQLSQVPAYIPLTYRACLKVLNNPDQYEASRLQYLYKAWHLLNDLKEKDPGFEMKPDGLMIFESLIAEKKPQHDTDFLRLAELFRELSWFEKAATTLDREFSFKSGAEAEQLMRAIEAKNSKIIYLKLEDTDSLSYAWQMRRFRPEVPIENETTTDINPPIFKISNRDWWIKVLGMLQHDWALIEDDDKGATTVYFFHDGGMTLSSTDFGRSEIKSRCAVVDSISFPSRTAALEALKKNGFSLLTERPGPWMNAYPRGHFYDARTPKERIYSNGGYWI
jgi:hypothetical protein